MVYIEPGKISNFDKGYYYIKDEDDRRNIKYFDYSAKKKFICVISQIVSMIQKIVVHI